MELYRGHYRTVVAAPYGKSYPAKEYLDGLQENERARLESLYRRRADSAHGEIFNHDQYRHEGEGIYCFKRGAQRITTFDHPDQMIVLLHGFRKQTQKMPTAELIRAMRIREEFVAKSRKGK